MDANTDANRDANADEDTNNGDNISSPGTHSQQANNWWILPYLNMTYILWLYTRV